MIRYKNLGGDSGVASYAIGADSIEVAFQDGSVYLYTYISTGREYIERMKVLAIAGRGLNAFINRYVKKRYAAKLR